MMNSRDAQLRLNPATDEDLAFARELTRVKMCGYYARFGLVWQSEAFKSAMADVGELRGIQGG